MYNYFPGQTTTKYLSKIFPKSKNILYEKVKREKKYCFASLLMLNFTHKKRKLKTEKLESSFKFWQKKNKKKTLRVSHLFLDFLLESFSCLAVGALAAFCHSR